MLDPQFPRRRPKLLSLFAGAGGLDIGLEQAGFQTVLANEIEPYACATLRANKLLSSLDDAGFDSWFEEQLQQRCYAKMPPDEKMRLRLRVAGRSGTRTPFLESAAILEHDVRQLSSTEILRIAGLKRGELDLIAGGPPCQPFSRAGKRETVDVQEGRLFLEFVRLVREIQPRYFLFENVKGLTQSRTQLFLKYCPACNWEALVEFCHRDNAEASIVGATCDNCGSTALKIISRDVRGGSKDIIEAEFERIGYRCSSQVLNAADFGAPQTRERLFIVGSRDGCEFVWPERTHGRTKGGNGPQLSLFGESKGSEWITMTDVLWPRGHWKYGPLDPSKAVLWVKNVVRPHDEPVTWSLDRTAPTIGAHQAAKLAIAPFGVPEAQLRRQQWHTLGRRQGDNPPVFVEHEYLTDEELLVLQTFPESWYLAGTRMQRAFQIGNAVPPILGAAVGNALIATMEKRKLTPAVAVA